MFIAALSGAVVALALVAQATDFGSGFVAFALVLLPVVYFLGVVTIARLAQVNHENRLWVQGMNRIRNAYLQLVPELEPYFVMSRYDDEAGVLMTSLGAHRALPRLQPFIAVPGVDRSHRLGRGRSGGAGSPGSGSTVGVGAALALGAALLPASRSSSSRSGRRSRSETCRPDWPALPDAGRLALCIDEAERPLGVGRRDLDRANRADRHDELLRLVALLAVRREGEEPETRLRARGRERVARPVRELDARPLPARARSRSRTP